MIPYASMFGAALVATATWVLCGQAEPGEPAVEKELGSPPDFELRIPATHPYLTLTCQDIERAKDRASRWDWAKQAIERCRSEADDVRRPWDKLPDKGDTEHRSIARRLFSAGLAYALSGEDRATRSGPATDSSPMRPLSAPCR